MDFTVFPMQQRLFTKADTRVVIAIERHPFVVKAAKALLIIHILTSKMWDKKCQGKMAATTLTFSSVIF